jgi:4-hydroxy-tetrahydrodipicolinate reductase
MIRIGITGCAGRMGRMLMAETAGSEGVTLAGGVVRAGNSAEGQDLGVLAGIEPCGVTATTDIAALFDTVDVVIDFTTPGATVDHAGHAADRGKALVIGTTGLDPAQEQALRRAAETAPIVFAANMSLGVNLLLGLTRKVAAALDADFDIEIVETHHRHKVDAPSGTALALGKAAAAGRGVALDAVAQRARDGHTGARRRGDIGFAVLRGGDVVGDHSVVFAGTGERIELTHRAGDRRIYSRGAVRAAVWAAGRAPGLYGMSDVLGL